MSIDNEVEKATLIWDEYKYRHEHCWKLLFQTTIAVVIVSIVPYTNDVVVKSLSWLILLLPLLGVILTVLSYRRLSEELNLWKEIRDKHKQFHKTVFNLEDNEPKNNTFRKDVLNYLIVLGILDFLNMFVMAFWWIPNLNGC